MLEITLLILLAVAPGALICGYVYWSDKYEREPLRLLLTTFVIGMLAVIPPVGMQILFDIAGFDITKSIAMTAFYTFVVVAFGEEVTKYLAIRLIAFGNHNFNEPYDGIMYSVMIAMGFASVENLFYILDGGGVDVAILRMFTAVPCHACSAVIMGYFLGLAKFRPKEEGYGLHLTAVIVPTITHGLYDFFLFLDHLGLIAFGAFAVLVITIIYARKAIQIHQLRSPFR